MWMAALPRKVPACLQSRSRRANWSLAARWPAPGPGWGGFRRTWSFNRFLTASDVGLYYQMTSGFAALGPISAEEQAGWGQRRGGSEQGSIHSPEKRR